MEIFDQTRDVLSVLGFNFEHPNICESLNKITQLFLTLSHNTPYYNTGQVEPATPYKYIGSLVSNLKLEGMGKCKT